MIGKLLFKASVCGQHKVNSRGQQVAKDDAFNSILHDLIQSSSKLDPKRWLTICDAALRQEEITPLELSPSSFEYLKKFAKGSTNNFLFRKKYSAEFNKLLAIAYISDYGIKAFINQQFDHRKFKNWLSKIAIPNIKLNYISKRSLEEIILTENNLISLSSNTNLDKLNINDCFCVPHDFGSRTYSNGDKYIGQLHNGVPNGKGTYLYASGAKYEGEMRNGQRDYNAPLCQYH